MARRREERGGTEFDAGPLVPYDRVDGSFRRAERMRWRERERRERERERERVEERESRERFVRTVRIRAA
jgi:hypothetical protein